MRLIVAALVMMIVALLVGGLARAAEVPLNCATTEQAAQSLESRGFQPLVRGIDAKKGTFSFWISADTHWGVVALTSVDKKTTCLVDLVPNLEFEEKNALKLLNRFLGLSVKH